MSAAAERPEPKSRRTPTRQRKTALLLAIGQAFKELRDKRTVAAIQPPSINRFENGGGISLGLLQAWCAEFDIAPIDVLDRAVSILRQRGANKTQGKSSANADVTSPDKLHGQARQGQEGGPTSREDRMRQRRVELERKIAGMTDVERAHMLLEAEYVEGLRRGLQHHARARGHTTEN